MAYNKSFNPDKLPVIILKTQFKQTCIVMQINQFLRFRSAEPMKIDRHHQQQIIVLHTDIWAHTRGSRVPWSPASPPKSVDTDRQNLRLLFNSVDKDGSGQLSEKELSQALVNGDWSPFDPITIRTMIRLFDTNHTGTINFEEFCGLWEFLGSWRTLFDHFDADGSGDINIDEYTNAFIAFGYRLSNPFVRSLFRKYDKRCEGAISFDLFVQSCICLKRMTNVFKRYDQDRDGYITLSL
ncbi:hypothetical protein Golomagni_05512 [Golovinomyces magnicellulatus]|nr:hypothetical protein Golomagni_05512 [Golovinomyces magnicellulatus]